MPPPPVILVTGSSRGLGRGIALGCARAGFSVGVHYAGNEAAAQETIEQCRSLAPDASQQFIPLRGNLALARKRADLWDQTLASFGRLDALVNNAAQYGNQPTQTRDGWPVRSGYGVLPGPADTFVAYGRGWANVSNVPFREYKHWVHEGGISTPLIIHRPAGIPAARPHH